MTNLAAQKFVLRCHTTHYPLTRDIVGSYFYPLQYILYGGGPQTQITTQQYGSLKGVYREIILSQEISPKVPNLSPDS
jgi:hypothetical protein